MTGRAEHCRELWKDPQFRARNAAASREMLAERWKDPQFRARHAAASREKGGARLRLHAEAVEIEKALARLNGRVPRPKEEP